MAAPLAVSWKNLGGSKSYEIPALPPVPQPGIYLVKQPLEQASVILGSRGPKRFTPDYVSIDLFNEIFGSSGFGSRLVEKVRTEKGFVYVIYGGITPDLVEGRNVVAFQTKPSTVGEGVDESLGVVKELQDGAFSSSKLSEVKEAIGNSWVFKFEGKGAVLQRIAGQRMLNFPPNYDKTYLPILSGLSQTEVMAAAKKYITPESFVVVVVGNDAVVSEAAEIQDTYKKRYGKQSLSSMLQLACES